MLPVHWKEIHSPFTMEVLKKCKHLIMLPNASSTGRASIALSIGLASSALITGLLDEALSFLEVTNILPFEYNKTLSRQCFTDFDFVTYALRLRLAPVGVPGDIDDFDPRCLSGWRPDARPFRIRLKDSRSDFLKDFVLDIGTSLSVEKSIKNTHVKINNVIIASKL